MIRIYVSEVQELSQTHTKLCDIVNCKKTAIRQFLAKKEIVIKFGSNVKLQGRIPNTAEVTFRKREKGSQVETKRKDQTDVNHFSPHFCLKERGCRNLWKRDGEMSELKWHVRILEDTR